MLSSRSLRRALAVTSAVAASEAGAAPDRGDARTFYATTNTNLLLQFDERRPDRLIDAQSILGLPAGVTLTGIDFRPKTGDLYGVGSDIAGADNTGYLTTRSRLYRVDPATGRTRLVGRIGNGRRTITGLAAW